MSHRGVFIHVERRSDLIRADEVRNLFRLEGELWELPRGSAEQHLHAVTGLMTLVGAQVGIWAGFGDLASTGGFIRDSIDTGWESDRERQVFHDYLRDGQRRVPDPSVPLLAQAVVEAVTPGVSPRPPAQTVSTFLRTQLMADREWYRAEHVQEVRRQCRVDGFLHSVRAHPQAGYVISLHRTWRQRPFSEGERRLVDLFHRESRALVPLAPAATPLPPHLERTLRGLLRGLTEKQVAADLGLSPHTVHEYVQALYRRLGVRSRAELFALRIEGRAATPRR